MNEPVHVPRGPAAVTKDPLFQGVTRPAMLMGVTYEAFVFNFLFTALMFLGSGRLMLLLVCIPVHLVCYVVCTQDVRFFGMVHLWLRTSGRNRNRPFWQANALSPMAARAAAARAPYLMDLAR